MVGIKQVDDRLMELLDERGKNKVTHRYVDFISNEDSASKGTIPPRGDEKSSLPPKEEIKIPPRARDGKTFQTDDELPEIEIAESTGASTATISRVNRSLNYGNDGYELVFNRMNKKTEE